MTAACLLQPSLHSATFLSQSLQPLSAAQVNFPVACMPTNAGACLREAANVCEQMFCSSLEASLPGYVTQLAAHRAAQLVMVSIMVPGC